MGGGGLREGDEGGGSLRAHGRAGGDQRDEPDRGGAAEPLAASGARGACSRDAVGIGLPSGDRPPAVRLAADQVGADRQGHRPHPCADRRGDRRGAGAAERADVRRLPARRRLPGGGGGGARATRAIGRQAGRSLRRGRRPPGERRAPGDHGRHRSLLGAGGGRAPRPGGGPGDPGVPQRDGPRVPSRRPRALLLPRARPGPEGGRRRPGGGRAARLPPRLRRLVRRGDPDRLAGHRAQQARRDPPAGDRAGRRHPRDARRPARDGRVPRGRTRPWRQSLARRASRNGVREARV